MILQIYSDTEIYISKANLKDKHGALYTTSVPHNKLLVFTFHFKLYL